jgi:hypothetical protein
MNPRLNVRRIAQGCALLLAAAPVLAAASPVYEMRIAAPGIVATPAPAPASARLAFSDAAGQPLTTLAFPAVPVGSPSAPVQVRLANSGGAPFLFGDNPLSSTAPFTVQSSTCISALDKNAECDITLAYTPTAPGAVSGSLSVAGATGAGPTLALTGAGVQTAMAGTVTPIWADATGYFNLLGVSDSQIVVSGNCQSVPTYSMGLDGAQLTSGMVNLANHAGIVTGELFAGKLIYRATGPVGQCYSQSGWPGAVGFAVPLNGAPAAAASSFSGTTTTDVFLEPVGQKLYGIDNDKLVEFGPTGAIARTFTGKPGNGWVQPLWRDGHLYVFVPSTPSSMWKYAVNPSTNSITYQGAGAQVPSAPARGRVVFDHYGDLVFVDASDPSKLRRVAMANFPSTPASVVVQLKNRDGSLFEGGAFSIMALRSNRTGLYALVRTNAGVTHIVRID